MTETVTPPPPVVGAEVGWVRPGRWRIAAVQADDQVRLEPADACARGHVSAGATIRTEARNLRVREEAR